MQIDGQCHCGAIAFEAEIDPDHIFLCHCEDCQIFSGAPFRTRIVTRTDRFRITHGKPQVYEKTAESGATRRMHFCGQCGTQIYGSSRPGDPFPISISGGTVRQKASLEPVIQAWCRSRLPWMERLAAIPELDRQDVPAVKAVRATGGSRDESPNGAGRRE